LEIYRRAQWNFLRVELEHLRLLNNFEPINGFDLPYNLDLDYKKNKKDQELMKKIISKQLKAKKNNYNLLIQNDGENLNYQIEIYRARKLKINNSKKEVEDRDILETKSVNFVGRHFNHFNKKNLKKNFTTEQGKRVIRFHYKIYFSKKIKQKRTMKCLRIL
jgi:hypothetical protein